MSSNELEFNEDYIAINKKRNEKYPLVFKNINKGDYVYDTYDDKIKCVGYDVQAIRPSEMFQIFHKESQWMQMKEWPKEWCITSAGGVIEVLENIVGQFVTGRLIHERTNNPLLACANSWEKAVE